MVPDKAGSAAGVKTVLGVTLAAPVTGRQHRKASAMASENAPGTLLKQDTETMMNLQFGQTFASWISESVAELKKFASTPEFQSVLAEMDPMTPREKDEFVRVVLLDPERRRARGLELPDGIVIQRTAFADKRPTIFCITKYLPDHIRKVTITYDDEGVPWSQVMSPMS